MTIRLRACEVFGETLIRLQGIHVTYRRWGQSLTALAEVDLEVKAGQWVMIVGHNGSGKSTLLKLIAGQQEATSGWVEINGSPKCGGAGGFDSDLFQVCQDPLLGTADGLTLMENLVVADPSPQGRGPSPRGRRDRYMELLSQFDLAQRANQLLRYFSGGERQQVALIIAKLRNPQILLLDEPLAALDPSRLPMCEQLIASMNAAGSTILQITHDMSTAQTTGHRTIAFEAGRILYDHSGEERSRTTSDLGADVRQAEGGGDKASSRVNR
ncbi:MAG: ATP-binding cassette domain-containing protein [Candidatus Accumulibacter sp.]|nr:ATP-binding cassette domain-containing protein [Candidatus Accumulibacter conexus]